MKKSIVFSNGTSELMECDTVFLNRFRGQAINELKKYKNGGMITEDDLQEMDIVIFKAFSTYDEIHCFSTHLGWKLKQYFVHIATNAKRKKRDNSRFKMLNLDFETNSGSGDKTNELHDLLADENAEFEDKLIDLEFIRYISSNLTDFEKKLLAVNLKGMRLIDLAEEQNTSKQNMNAKNNRFKKKLYNLICEFNSEKDII